ncbi:MAG: hypothetical protein ACO25B_06910 [Chitinophagaceae bacterium]
MRNKIIQGLTPVIILMALFSACRHELIKPPPETGGPGPVTANACNPDSAYFYNDIMPIIASNCTMSGCHDDITHADGVYLTTYTRVMRYVRPYNTSDSKLYTVITKTNGDRMPPAPRAPLSVSQIALIRKWIEQGATSNSCKSACDTAVFTYSGAVKPIMDYKCAGCHNPSNLGGNIDVSTYTGLRIVALNGKLYGSVSHQTGYSPMPKNSPKLSDCEIRQIQKWITAGALNN